MTPTMTMTTTTNTDDNDDNDDNDDKYQMIASAAIISTVA